MAMRVVILREGLAMEAWLVSYLFFIYFIIYNGIYNEVGKKIIWKDVEDVVIKK